MKKTYYPSKTFDDNLDAFAKLYKEKGWSFSGVDMEPLYKDANSAMNGPNTMPWN